MKTLYIDCGMGAAGDMLTAALLELHPSPEDFLNRFNAIGIPGVTVSATSTKKCGIVGTHVTVLVNGQEEDEHMHEHHHGHEHHDHEHHDHEHCHEHEHSHEHKHEHSHEHEHCHEHEHSHEHTHHHHEHSHEHEHCHEHEHNHEHTHHHHHGHSHGHGHHHHASMHDIEHVISHLSIPEEVKKDVVAVYNLIAQAESKSHGVPVTEIHFHEVGTMDAVADVTAVCMLIHELGIDKIISSPVHVGSGQVKCAHGILPVPAPATAHILMGCPIYGGNIKTELCTPTGAAILKHFVNEFGSMPVMTVESIGYGMGKKDFEAANCVRVMLGETM